MPKLFLVPGNRDLNEKSLSIEAYHGEKTENSLMTEFNYHNLHGYLQGKTTSEWFLEKVIEEGTTTAKPIQRPFILSRSTFPGQGRYTSHWLGDNYSTYRSFKASTAGVYTFNAFGISQVGGDICGFMRETTPELCSRWTTLGAFMPFARNHNGKGEMSQEPYAFEDAENAHMKRAIKLRYSFITHLYTQMHIVVREGGTVVRPQFYNYPADVNALANPEENIMIGDSIKLAMSYKQGINSETFYFAAGLWANIVDGTI